LVGACLVIEVFIRCHCPGGAVCEQAESAKHFVRNKAGGDFDGWCWPGSSSYLDVTSPAVREW
jgi:mannosyl-oligosaccharide alpha-1,3-glucosidase